MTDHDPLCTAPQYWHSPGTAMATCQCHLIAKARTDERMKVGTEANAVVRQKDERIADLLENWDSLRAQVEALRDGMESKDGFSNGWNFALRRVLKLLDGGQ